MNKERFMELCDASYSHIPVYEEFVADLISPLYIFSNFYQQPNCFLFESAKSHEVKGRYSIMTLPSALRYDFFENELHINDKKVIKIYIRSMTEINSKESSKKFGIKLFF